eukprot:5772696-Amphidinium_carterae.1
MSGWFLLRSSCQFEYFFGGKHNQIFSQCASALGITRLMWCHVADCMINGLSCHDAISELPTGALNELPVRDRNASNTSHVTR